MRSKIAIIDDEIDIGYLLKSNFDAKLYDVFCFQDLLVGVSALEALNPQFLFLDVNFPNGNGLDHVQNIRKLVPNCFIIIISAQDELRHILHAKQEGAHDFIAKPFTRDIILERVRSFTNSTKS